MEEILKMSTKEIDRHAVLQQVQNKQITQRRAAEILGITDRQVRNLLTTVKNDGKKGLISKRRGRLGNNTLPQELKEKVLSLIKTKYQGFRPIFASEKLQERD